MYFIIYVVGFFVLIAGIGYGAWLLHVPQSWIVVGGLIIVGAATMSSGSHIKRHFYPGDAPDA